MVVEKYLSEGERVEEKAVVKVATIDPLRVEVIVPSTYFSKIKTGMVATVKPDMADAEARPATVIVVDRVIDAASNSFRVRLELPNPDNALPPGLRCKLDFEGMSTAENAVPRPALGAAPSKDPATKPAPAVAPAAKDAATKPMPEEPAHKPAVKASVAAAPSK